MMSKLEQLFVCVVTEQMSAREIADAMRDLTFAAYYAQRISRRVDEQR